MPTYQPHRFTFLKDYSATVKCNQGWAGCVPVFKKGEGVYSHEVGLGSTVSVFGEGGREARQVPTEYLKKVGSSESVNAQEAKQSDTDRVVYTLIKDFTYNYNDTIGGVKVNTLVAAPQKVLKAGTQVSGFLTDSGLKKAAEYKDGGKYSKNSSMTIPLEYLDLKESAVDESKPFFTTQTLVVMGVLGLVGVFVAYKLLK